MEVLPVFLFRAHWPEPDPHEQATVINYRLIEEHSQAFNEGLFHTVSFIINAFEKKCEFSL